MSGWVFDTRQKPRPDPVPHGYRGRTVQPGIHVPVTIGWALVGDVFYMHNDDATTDAIRLRYHVDKRGIVTTRSEPCDEPAPAGLTWHVPDASATSNTDMLPGVPVVRE